MVRSLGSVYWEDYDGLATVIHWMINVILLDQFLEPTDDIGEPKLHLEFSKIMLFSISTVLHAVVHALGIIINVLYNYNLSIRSL